MDKSYRPPFSAAAGAAAADYDQGLRAYLLGVYNYMALGIGLTGLVAFLTAHELSPLRSLLLPMLYTAQGPSMFGYLVMFAPLAFVMILSFGINRLSVPAAQGLFWLFAGVMGLSLANVLLVFTQESIARVFFITAATFGAMSLYGYTTKRDLSGFGSFLFMGLIGVILASLVNLFIGSTAIQFAVSVVGLLVFVGLTAYDTQMIKRSYGRFTDPDMSRKMAITGALSLYLNFINIFLLLLQLFGSRR